MPVSKDDVLATAALCRVDLSASSNPGESADALTARFASELSAVVTYMDILNQVDTEGVEPLYSPLQESAPPREDVAAKRLTVEDLLAGAPERRQSFFVVPPVI